MRAHKPEGGHGELTYDVRFDKSVATPLKTWNFKQSELTLYVTDKKTRKSYKVVTSALIALLFRPCLFVFSHPLRHGNKYSSLLLSYPFHMSVIMNELIRHFL